LLTQIEGAQKMSASISQSLAVPTERVPSSSVDRWITPMVARGIFILAIAAGAVCGAAATGMAETQHAVAREGADWANLLRAMAALKILMEAGASAGVLWRLGSPVGPMWLAAYAAAGAIMAAGPGLIWGLVHVALGALLLHAGLVATIILLWRDKAVGARLAALVAARRG
jgi:hypothetical protein